MDPNATLTAIRVAIELRVLMEAHHYRTILVQWLERGGFHPDWGREPLATQFCANDPRFAMFGLH